jgi:hypothetical protein
MVNLFLVVIGAITAYRLWDVDRHLAWIAIAIPIIATLNFLIMFLSHAPSILRGQDVEPEKSGRFWGAVVLDNVLGFASVGLFIYSFFAA